MALSRVKFAGIDSDIFTSGVADSAQVQAQFDSAFPSAFDTRFALQDTHDSAQVQAQFDSAFPSAFDTRFALQDTHDSAQVQAQIDSAAVTLTGNQTIAGTKTFSSTPKSSNGFEAATAFRFTKSTISGTDNALYYDSDHLYVGRDAPKIRFRTDGTQRMEIDGTNVGIGTSSPQNTLSVAGTVGDHVGIGDAGSNYEILLGGWSGTGDADIDGLLPGSTFGSILRSAHNGHMVVALRDNDVSESFAVVAGGGNWQTDSVYDTLAFRVDARGHAETAGNLSVGKNETSTGSEGGQLTLYNDSGNSGQFNIDVAGSLNRIFTVRNNEDFLIGGLGGTGHTIKLYTSGAQRARIDDDGLKFGTDTAAANALDDYEEGTWDPRPSTSNSSLSLFSGLTLVNYTGNYQKVGGWVTCQYYFEWSSTNTSTSQVYMILPFACASNKWSGCATETSKVNFPNASVGYITVRPEANQSFATFKACGDNITRINMTGEYFFYNSGGYALGTFTYPVA